MRAAPLLALAVACGGPPGAGFDAPVVPPDVAPDAAPAFAWNLPPGFPEPVVPDDNPMSDAKVELGRYLFYDTRMSGNQTYSCASCHEQELAFTDGLAQAVGSTGQLHTRSAMSLANVGYLGRFGWGNPLLDQLETQAVVPIFGSEPVELGMKNMEGVLIQRISDEPSYPPRFAAAFPGEPAPITVANIVKAISAFERTLISGDSPFDRYSRGDATAITESARRGYDTFNSEKAECFHCHGGFDLTDTTRYVGHPTEARFHNTGLYNLHGTGDYPVGGQGIYELTLVPSDMGKFRAPSLRNIAVTGPYFHDGSAPTLDDVLDHYIAGGRTIASGPNAGVGADNPFEDSLIRPLPELTAQDRADLLALFASLTDDTFLTDPRFGNPWPRQRPPTSP